ncbi:MAG TPA: phosphoglucomutase/phosphomannomutase family protein [Elusimicrobiota bacterium]|nr:phosphoglucomutase/phosphomannomutase family protein [Elusimicrobiota bacterium]
MDPIKFGTDGWRGVIARDFTFENVRRVAQAIADYVKEDQAKNARKKTPLSGPIVIGFDKRFQSDMFAREIAKVLEANHLNPTLMAESLPTPAVSFMTSKLGGAGVMVTASHNPPSYNGVKIKIDGRAALENVTQGVESWIDRTAPTRAAEIKTKSFRDQYLAYLKSRVDMGKIKSKLKKPVVVDYMHGAASGLMADLLPSKQLIEIRSAHDPLFGGVHPEPIEQYLGALSEAVKKNKAMIGLALDGDADRFGLVDENGKYLTPCQVFPMICLYLIEHKKFSGKIVQSVSLGYLVERICKEKNIPFEQLPVGFKHVAEKLAIGEAVIAGEESGGYAWKGAIAERDGMLTAALFLEMCTTTGKTPSELWKDVEKRYGASFYKRIDYRIHRPIADKALWTTKLIKKLPKKLLNTPIKDLIQTDGLKIVLEDGHWLLMRPSGTEPLMRVYAESDKPERTQALLDAAKKWVAPSLGAH